MPREALLECSFFIPRRRDKTISDGRRHRLSTWYWLRNELEARFGAQTKAPGLYEGSWTDSKGKRVRDFSRRFIVAVPKNRLPELRTVLASACVMFHQQAIYLSVAGRVEFISARVQ